MKIVLVIDQFDDANNGTTISARRFAQALKNHGNEVRVIATGKPADYKYAVRQMRFFPVVEHLITSQGMRLGHPKPPGVVGQWGCGCPSPTAMCLKRRRPGRTWCIS